jgi:predicted transcriptional regulator
VHSALKRVAVGQVAASAEPLKPAVPIKRSVTPEHIVCLEDGLKFKSLKRHLRTRYNLTPDQYREKWGLPPDYSMVAPNYAAARSQLAKQMGLGQQRRRRK